MTSYCTRNSVKMRHCLVKMFEYKILTFMCWIGFAWQLSKIGYALLYPTQKTTEIKKIELKELPVVFKICPQPAFNVTALRSEGYEDVFHYFLGRSLYNNSVYGWAGHSETPGGRNKTVNQVYQEIVLYRNIHDIVKK